jgi:ornithine cyclodeaminase/alanine dehydrogenase-like protein (mu-crystallin family)
MPIFLSNKDQEKAITAAGAIDALEKGLRQFARGDAVRRPRIDNFIPSPVPDQFFAFSSMEGGIRDPGYYALRIKPDMISWPVVDGTRRRVTYNTRPGLYGGLVFLFSVANAELLAIMNDGFIQHYRVAAAAAIGAKYLSRRSSSTLGIIGTGGMAHSFAETFTSVRDIKKIKVFSPNKEHVKQYVRDVSKKVGCEIVPVENAKDALIGCDIFAACTNAYQPVVEGKWLEPGTHIANVTAYEIGSDIFDRIDVVGLFVRRTPMSIANYVDDDFAPRIDGMTYAAGRPEERAKIPPSSAKLQSRGEDRARFPNARYVDCTNWETGESFARARDDEITTLENNSYGTLPGDAAHSAGIQGIQFSSVGGRIYELAMEKNLGTKLPSEMFLQDIPT